MTNTNNQTNQPRLLLLSSHVDSSSMGDLIQKIIAYNIQDDYLEAAHTKYERQPIILIINSYGGVVYDGWGLIGAIETSTTPVVTVCAGSAMSMALAIFVAGHTRIMYSYSTLMYHEISDWNIGKLTEQKINIEELERLQAQYDLYILDRTKITESKLEEVRRGKDEWYIDGFEAMKYGIVDLVADQPLQWNA